MRIRSHRIQGFTLLELLVVLGLMALLATVALVAVEGARDDAAYTTTRAEMTEMRKALRLFRQDVGHFPDAEELISADLRTALLSNCQSADATKINAANVVSYDAGCSGWNPDTKRGWHGPYLSSGGDQDAWGKPYQILDPDLDHPIQTHWCDPNGENCQATQDAGHPIPDNGARLVSHGPNGAYEGLNVADVCQKNGADSDDIVVCLVR